MATGPLSITITTGTSPTSVPGTSSGPGLHYYETTYGTESIRIYDNGVLYSADSATGINYWSVPDTTTGGVQQITQHPDGTLFTDRLNASNVLTESTVHNGAGQLMNRTNYDVLGGRSVTANFTPGLNQINSLQIGNGDGTGFTLLPTELDELTLNSVGLYDQNSISDRLIQLGLPGSGSFMTDGFSALGAANSGLNQNIYTWGNNRYYFGGSSVDVLLTIPKYIAIPSYLISPIPTTSLPFLLVNPAYQKAIDNIGGAKNYISPLVLDLDGDGVAADLTHAYDDGNVFFDIDGDGFAERVGWVNPNDGLLATDTNGNGNIDDITELYGDDKMPAFQKLRGLDANADGQITAADAGYANLLVWQDANQDGISQSGELRSLASLNIASISTNDHNVLTWSKENYISSTASYTLTNGVTREISDVHFLNDNLNSWYLGAHSQVYGADVKINLEAIMLPLSRGYGTLPSLHLAMSSNPTLLQLVKELAYLQPERIAEASALVENILFEWAGVAGNDPNARATGDGVFIDARKVDFIEKFSGVIWAQRDISAMAGEDAATALKKTWEGIQAVFVGRLLVQGPLKGLFPSASYDFVADQLTLGGTLDGILAQAGTYAAQIAVNGIADTVGQGEFWRLLGTVLADSRGQFGKTIAEIDASVSAAAGFRLYLGEMTLTAADVGVYTGQNNAPELLNSHTFVGDAVNNTIAGTNGEDFIFGGGGDDRLNGGRGDDFLRGDTGSDQLDGGAGADRIEGGAGADTISGGDDTDYILGGDGNDVIRGDAGDDLIAGGAGADNLDGGAGRDTVFFDNLINGGYINLATGEVHGAGLEGDVISNFESIRGGGLSDVLVGDNGANVLNGESGDDILIGGGGHDHLFGAEGRNKLYGGEGNDLLDAYQGNEYFDGGAGWDTVSFAHPYVASGVYVDLSLGRGLGGAARGDVFVDVEALNGSYNYGDVLIGSNGDNALNGNGGQDVLRGEGGNDTLYAANGVSHLFGGSGGDYFAVLGKSISQANVMYANTNSTSTSGPTVDTYAVELPENAVYIHDFELNNPNEKIDLSDVSITQVVLRSRGSDVAIALDGNRTLYVLGVSVSQLNAGHFILPAGVTGLTVETEIVPEALSVLGSDADNKLYGGSGQDTLEGYGGNDALVAGRGNDTLRGGSGNDLLVGGLGADVIDGGAGIDQVRYDDSFEGVVVNLANGTGAGGTAAGDQLSNIEKLTGSNFGDVLRGANIGQETIEGLNGNDTLVGGNGNNTLSGGDGADRFVIEAYASATAFNTITDFDLANPEEKIDLSAFDFTGKRLVAEWNAGLTELSFYTDTGALYKGALKLTGLNFGTIDTPLYKLPDIQQMFTFATGKAPLGFEVRAPAGTPVFGSNGTDLLKGANSYYYPYSGNDTIDIGANQSGGFFVTRQPGQVVRIQNFQNKIQRWGFTPALGGPEITKSLSDVRNGWFNLSDHPDIRGFGDIAVSAVTSGPDAGTHLDLGNGQKIILLGWFEKPLVDQRVYDYYNWVGFGCGTVHLTIDYGLKKSDRFTFFDGVLDGTFGNDKLNGGKYGDTISGGFGNDVINGGGGSDTLEGGDGSDTFVIQRKAGATDRIKDFQFWQHGDAIDLSAFTEIAGFSSLKRKFSRQGNDTVVSLGAGQSLVIEGVAPELLGRWGFKGNSGLNTAPTGNISVSGIAKQNQTLTAVSTLADADGLGVIAYQWQSSVDGATWANISGATSSTLALAGAEVGKRVRVNASYTDGQGTLESVNSNATTAIINTNNAPVSASVIVNQMATEDAEFRFTVPGNSFTDVDVGDTLTLTASLADGTALPSWLSFDGASRTFSGTPRNSDVGSLNLKVTATDQSGSSVFSTFEVAIANVNDAPILATSIADQAATEGMAFSFTVPSNAFTDVDMGDSLSYSVTLSDGSPLPSWLAFDATTRSVSGIPSSIDVGSTLLRVTATDMSGASTSDVFALTVASVPGLILTGTVGDDLITGDVGNDTLDGGAGADTLLGGRGNDLYFVDNESDVVIENTGEGTDTVETRVDYILGANIENARVGGWGWTDVTGNELDNVITGNTGNNLLDGGAGADTLIGGEGNDTYVVDNAGDMVIENLNEGVDTVQSSVSYALSANIENLTLTGTAAIDGRGNELDNVLEGNDSANILTGGLGNDTYIIHNAGDVVVENANEGIDTVETWVDYTLAANIENARAGSWSWADITGNELDNAITGGSGNNLLNGGAGADTLIGGEGNDTYVVDNTGDVVAENINEGIDIIESSVSYTLSSNVENLTLTGIAAIDGTGNDLDNVLEGNDASSTLIGGLGNDTYVINNAGTVAVENVGEGTDTVETWVDYTLGANIENARAGSWAWVDIIGNELDNVITGGSGNNLLNGGLGADTLIGGEGNDTYVVDNTGDVVTENPNEGIDTVQSSVSYAMSANVENLILTGIVAIDGTGNDLNNVMEGNDASSRLTGGLGNDSYIVNNTGTVIVENANEGIDTVETWVDYTLGANIENAHVGGLGWIDVTGNELDNVITGNASNNLLNGELGSDYLIGGDGNDIYVVENVGDVVTENLNEGIDTIQSSVSYALSANVENLILTGTGAIDGTGNDLDNVLEGNSAVNVLAAGVGNDTYIIQNAGDVVIENANEGLDTVETWVDYTLGANIENARVGDWAWADITGNNLDNVITGSTGNNLLNGGFGADTLIGGEGNDTLIGGAGNDLIIGGMGDDTYVVDNAGDTLIENVNEGFDTVQSDFAYALSANIENLTLTGTAAIDGTGNELDNVLTGNDAANILMGGAGNDTLDGGAGTDILMGGIGNDTYVIYNAEDAIVENANEGVDTVETSVDYTLGANIENARATSWSWADITGNELDNVITGGSGNNVLNGGLGADTLTGMEGDDTYVVDNVADTIVENANEGTDTVESSVSYALSANVENLTLAGIAAIDGTGNNLDNVLEGNDAANILAGGLGNDTYIVHNVGDVVVENANEGTDTVETWVDYVMDANVENVRATSWSWADITGNALDNSITGGSGNNCLDGGAGADTLIGKEGNDTYVVDNAGDVVTENLNEGVDTVQASVSYALSANVENLTLTGIGAIDGTGNDLDNVLEGNDSANILTGGLGNDTYIIHNAGDVVVENANGGIDTVETWVDYVMDANVENVHATSWSWADITGNDLNNIITGGSGNNRLDGGIGADTLIGMEGNDTYVVDNIGDTIVENANEGTDTVESSVSYALSANVENLTLTGIAAIDGTGNNLDNVLEGNDSANILTGGLGNDTYIIHNAGDVVVENANGGIDTVETWVDYVMAANVENVHATSWSWADITGNELDNLITAGSGNNLLNGGAGMDFLEGMAGNDTLIDTMGKGYFNGGDGADALTGGADNDFLLGGLGNDTLNVDGGCDIIAFNRGDGQDIVNGGIGTDNTISLGGGIQYADLALSKTGNDLILEVGNGDQITLTGWYDTAANCKSVLNLQMVTDAMAGFDRASSDPLLNKSIQDFDFTAIVNAFDQARGANANFMSWSATACLQHICRAAIRMPWVAT